MSGPAPTLSTDRLILRPPLAADLEPWLAFSRDPEVMGFLGGVQTPTGAWRGLAGVAGAWALDGFGMFSVLERASGRWIGRVGPWRPLGWPGPEVGWGLARAAWGQGYAQEAATASIDWAFDHLGWNEVIHCIRPQNTPSIALAGRLGSAHLGVGRLPDPHDPPEIDLYGQTADQWRARRR